ncbi:MAG: DUF4890 domain-containing protein [Cytophagaceae bacterium]|nr:DUF4890 domain-containing protein [Cytophagaceae bacterium]MDW8457349.1 hypothetical protein [Cytophagaceae bacterium]
MRKKFFLIFILVAAYAIAIAQGKKWSDLTPEEKAEKLTNRMKNDYNLSDEQASKVKQLNLERFTKIAAAKRKYTIDQKKEYQQERKMINQQFNQGLKSVLTDEQYQKHLQKIEERKKNAMSKKQPKDGNKLPPHPALMEMEEEIAD